MQGKPGGTTAGQRNHPSVFTVGGTQLIVITTWQYYSLNIIGLCSLTLLEKKGGGLKLGYAGWKLPLS